MTGRGDVPPGARADDSAVPGGFTGGDARARWRAAVAAHKATLRRKPRRRAAGGYRAGMTRIPPPPPDEGDAA